jgi:hypothetical protein
VKLYILEAFQLVKKKFGDLQLDCTKINEVAPCL